MIERIKIFYENEEAGAIYVNVKGINWEHVISIIIEYWPSQISGELLTTFYDYQPIINWYKLSVTIDKTNDITFQIRQPAHRIWLENRKSS